MSIAKTFRLHLEKDFKRIINKGQYFGSTYISIKILKNNLDNSRFAILVGKSISKKAVTRNIIKRRIKEVIRQNLDLAAKGYDIIFFIKKSILELDFEKTRKEILLILKKTKIL